MHEKEEALTVKWISFVISFLQSWYFEQIFRTIKKKKSDFTVRKREYGKREYRIYNVVTRAHCELWVAWESFASVAQKEKKKRQKKKKCNDVVTPLTICNANDVAPDFSFLCNTSSIRNYHIKSPLVNKFFIAPPVFGPLYFFIYLV